MIGAQKGMHPQIKKALEQFEPMQREVFQRRYERGESQEETCKALSMSAEQYEQLREKGLRALRKSELSSAV